MNMFRFFQSVGAAFGLSLVSSCVPVPVGGHGGYGHGYGHGGGYGGRPVLVPTGRQVLVPTGQRVLIPAGHSYGGYGGGYSHGYPGHSGSRGIQPCDPRYYEPGRRYFYEPPPVTIPPAHYGRGGYGSYGGYGGYR